MWDPQANGPFEGKHYKLAETLCVPAPVSNRAASGKIGSPTKAPVPALDTANGIDGPSRARSRCASRRSAVGDRQMFPVQTNSTANCIE